VHQLNQAQNPCQDAKVRELISKTRRAYAKRGVTQDKKAALTKEPLEALLATCDDSLRGVRDRALLLFAWSSGGRRRSEVTDATMENVRKVGERAHVFTLLRTKTNQSGSEQQDSNKPLVGRTADALETWLSRSGITAGPILRRIRRGERVAEPLSPAAVRDIVKSRTAAAGLAEDFSAHSVRSGFVTEAARQNIPIGETMALTGHASVATVVGYFRTVSSLESKAARLLGDES
jgi:integrase